ncbi:MAG: RIP metalloprotease RseP [Luteolibacter sp.]|uniref:RIP metalloprotease RseP n=1 Tax=Luteolibacter sp. TaxID=1962973 RepID=UPI003267860A
MSTVSSILQVILLIFAVVMGFNIIIFVHELGHFLAAKWRGLQIDRFQIWFGSPIWKKTIGGVQYGLGWIPAGGFVALPQMAPMEALEGGSKDGKTLSPITPLDKIIVAFAGPLFSMLLALLSAVVVYEVGKPADFIPTQVIGGVDKDSPAAKAGIQSGDKILAINGNPVNGFAGSLDSITEGIILSKGKQIEFTVLRPGSSAPIKLTSEFQTEKTKWFQRGGLRQVGIRPEAEHVVIAAVYEGSPGAKAGFKEGDLVVSMNGHPVEERDQAVALVKETGANPITIAITRDGKPLEITATPLVPISPANSPPMLGLAFDGPPYQQKGIIHPGPIKQVSDSLRMMWTTITSVVAKDSSIGVGHLSGPVGIATLQYQLLQMEDGWRRILAFMVLFNVNLAVLNMMPFPVLDGGHIVLAILEKIFGGPVKAKPLEILQTICALALISLMLFVTSKDIGDKFGHGDDREKVVFPTN